MNIVTILWQLGILSAIMVFGIKIGLASGLANLNKKYAFLIAIGYGLGVLGLSLVADIYAEQLTTVIYDYNTWFFLVMAAIMIISGLFTIREWKVNEKNTTTATCLAVIAPCPCCFGSIIASVLFFAPVVGLGTFTLSQYVALALTLIILITYFLSNAITNFIKTPYPIVLGNFMFFLGIYFLASSLILPNISEAIGKQMGKITIYSPESLTVIIIAFIILLILGIIVNKKHDLLNN